MSMIDRKQVLTEISTCAKVAYGLRGRAQVSDGLSDDSSSTQAGIKRLESIARTSSSLPNKDHEIFIKATEQYLALYEAWLEEIGLTYEELVAAFRELIRRVYQEKEPYPNDWETYMRSHVPWNRALMSGNIGWWEAFYVILPHAHSANADSYRRAGTLMLISSYLEQLDKADQTLFPEILTGWAGNHSSPVWKQFEYRLVYTGLKDQE
ncbi:MAG: hypothetical protein IPI24_13460 [Ignavibacteria bacterium]|nr:hypothetical protein [Ignavibacteria bacterium]